ncbi:MAG TPA: MinD/ParA family protein [Anaerolineales bacterium]|nr:MinD/ParA family protein [Anaerolineales bacterium]
MTKIIGIHSFRRGTGKTFFTGNLGLLLAKEGWRVAVVDTDFQAPDLHTLFDLPLDEITTTLNDFLDGNAPLEKVNYDITHRASSLKGQLYLLPASTNTGDITKILRQGYAVEKLGDAFRKISQAYNLDAILMDTSAGLTEESLRSLALADSVAIVMLPDQQHFQGTAVMADLAHQLRVPSVSLVVNQVPEVYKPAQVKQEIETKYETPVLAVLPFVEECRADEQFFVLKYPTHPLTISLMQIVLGLLK